MVPNLNNNTFENLSLVLMFPKKHFSYQCEAKVLQYNVLLFKCGTIYAIGLYLPDFYMIC